MRVFVVPVVVVAGVLAAVSAADPVPGASAGRTPRPLPPPLVGSGVNQLRADVAALAKEREEAAKDTGGAGAATDRAVLRAQLADLLKRLNDRPPVASPPQKSSPHPQSPWVKPERSLDTIRMAENLFRDGDVPSALAAFQQIDRGPLPREDRAFVQYMIACCLRKSNKRSEAAAIYREVADAKEDEFVAECAIWQLSLIRSTQELEAQLEQLRSRPKSR